MTVWDYIKEAIFAFAIGAIAFLCVAFAGFCGVAMAWLIHHW